METQLLCIGHAAVDVTARIPAFPAPDAKLLADEMAVSVGGPAAVAALTAARLGIKTAFVGITGDDICGNFLRDEMEKNRVNITGMQARENASSPVSFIMAEKEHETRTVIWSRGSAGILEPFDLDYRIIKNASCLLVDGHHMPAATAAAEYARRHGTPVVLDAGSIKPGTDEILKHVDHLIASHTFAQTFCDDDDPTHALRRFAEMGFPYAAVTVGRRGVFFLDRTSLRYLVPFDVPVVDTTGAGDVFHGAYAAALIKGNTMEERVVYASAAAAMRCARLGRTDGIPDAQQLTDFILDRYRKN